MLSLGLEKAKRNKVKYCKKNLTPTGLVIYEKIEKKACFDGNHATNANS